MEEFLTQDELDSMQYSDLDWYRHSNYYNEEDEDETNLDGNLS